MDNITVRVVPSKSKRVRVAVRRPAWQEFLEIDINTSVTD